MGLSESRETAHPRTEMDHITLAFVGHCEHPKGAWQSPTKKGEIASPAARNDA